MNKNNISKYNDDFVDNMLRSLAQKSYEPIPEDIHNNIIKTIDSIDLKNKSSNRQRIRKTAKSPFKRTFGTIVTNPCKLIAITFLLVILIGTGAVGARNISEKYFKKDNVRLDNIGIANEFIFTEEIESALKQNVPLNLVELDDNYYISVHSLLLNEINFFTVFELHSKSEVTEDLRFIIRDLKITDESGTTLYCSNLEPNSNNNSGYKHIYNRENSIKELFFMFGNDSSRIKELNYSFSNIDIYKYSEDMTENPDFKDIHLAFEEKNINVTITKNNYNTFKEYILENKDINNKYDIQKTIYTNTGLHILAECDYDATYPLIEINHNVYSPVYKLPIKRTMNNDTLMLYAYNIKEIISDNIIIYNNLDKEKYNLIQKK